MPNEPQQSQLDELLRGKQVAQIIGRDLSTIWGWIKRREFPAPLVLNPGQRREIVGWRRSDVEKWIASRPQRLAMPVTQNAYQRFRKKISRPGT